MTRFHRIAATAVVALGASLSFGGVAASAHTSSGSQLTSDVTTAVQSGELATANDQSRAAEENVDDGQVENVDECQVEDVDDSQVENVDAQDNDTCDHQTGESANDQSTASEDQAGATTSGQSAESSGDKGATTNGQTEGSGVTE
jgi:hypothetical protein